jgi:hypothetical protein
VPRLGTGDRHLAVTVEQFDRTQDVELHRVLLPSSEPGRNAMLPRIPAYVFCGSSATSDNSHRPVMQRGARRQQECPPSGSPTVNPVPPSFIAVTEFHHAKGR